MVLEGLGEFSYEFHLIGLSKTSRRLIVLHNILQLNYKTNTTYLTSPGFETPCKMYRNFRQTYLVHNEVDRARAPLQFSGDDGEIQVPCFPELVMEFEVFTRDLTIGSKVLELVDAIRE